MFFSVVSIGLDRTTLWARRSTVQCNHSRPYQAHIRMQMYTYAFQTLSNKLLNKREKKKKLFNFICVCTRVRRAAIRTIQTVCYTGRGFERLQSTC